MTASPTRNQIDSAFREQARQRSAEPAVISQGTQTSFSELLAGVLRIGDALESMGASGGARVLLIGDGADATAFVATYFGIHAAGGWATPVAPDALARELGAYIDDLRPHAIVDARPAASRRPIEFEGSATLAQGLAVELSTSAGPCGVTIFPVQWATETHPRDLPDLDPAGGDIIYTTGTTGKPKGVVLPHDIQFNTGVRYTAAQALQPGSTIQSAIPLYTASAIMSLILPVAATGATFVAEHPFRADFSAALAEKWGVTAYKGVPAHFVLLGRSSSVTPVPKVRMAITTAARVSGEALLAIQRLFPNARVISLFGSTESAGSFTICSGERLRDNVSHLGEPAPEVEIDVRSRGASAESDRERREGDLILRGPYVASGYWRRDEATNRSTFLAPNEVLTGDLAYETETGWVLGGRTSASINRGGFKIDPGLAERVVSQVEGIEDCCVVAIPHDVLGEEMVLVVQRDDESTDEWQPLLSDLSRSLSSRLRHRERPRFIAVVEQLPRNRHGKVDRSATEQLARSLPRDRIAPIPTEA